MSSCIEASLAGENLDRQKHTGTTYQTIGATTTVEKPKLVPAKVDNEK